MHIYQILFVLIALSYLVYSEKRDDVLFHKIGTYTKGNIEKTYWIPRHMRAQWHLTRPICKAHGFDIVTIETMNEFEHVAELCGENKHMFYSWYVHIGGVVKVAGSLTKWYWITTNEKFSYIPPFRNGEPNNYGNDQYCLAMARDHGFQFDDINCHGSWEEMFMCESVRHLGGSSQTQTYFTDNDH